MRCRTRFLRCSRSTIRKSLSIRHSSPGPAKKPRAQQTQDHTSAIVNWRKFSLQGKRSNLHQQLPTQSRSLYSVGFLFAADFCRAFESFGGLAAQLGHLLGDRLIDRGIRLCSDQLRLGPKVKLQGKDRLRNPDASEFSRPIPS